MGAMAVLKAVEHSSNETLEAVEEVCEAVEETRSELKEGFQEVADAFMRLEESVLDGLDALEDRQAELRKAERAARREISAGEAQVLSTGRRFAETSLPIMLSRPSTQRFSPSQAISRSESQSMLATSPATSAFENLNSS
jgi:septation ring formation regulator EzrA